MEDSKEDLVRIYIKPTQIAILHKLPLYIQIKLFCLFNQIPFVVFKEDRVNPNFGFPFIEFRGDYIKIFSEIEKTLKNRFIIPTYEKENEIIAMTNTTKALFDIQKLGDEQYLKNAFNNLPENSFLKTKLDEIVDSLTAQKLKNNNDRESFILYLTLIEELIKEHTFLFGNMISTADIMVYSMLSSLHDNDPESPPATLLRDDHPLVIDYLKKIHGEQEMLLKKLKGKDR